MKVFSLVFFPDPPGKVALYLSMEDAKEAVIRKLTPGDWSINPRLGSITPGNWSVNPRRESIHFEVLARRSGEAPWIIVGEIFVSELGLTPSHERLLEEVKKLTNEEIGVVADFAASIMPGRP